MFTIINILSFPMWYQIAFSCRHARMWMIFSFVCLCVCVFSVFLFGLYFVNHMIYCSLTYLFNQLLFLLLGSLSHNALGQGALPFRPWKKAPLWLREEGLLLSEFNLGRSPPPSFQVWEGLLFMKRIAILWDVQFIYLIYRHKLL